MDQYWEREIRRHEGSIKTLSERIDYLAKRISALESVSPSPAPASESACFPHPLADRLCTSCGGSGYLLFDNTCDCVDTKARAPTTTGETPPTAPSTGPDPYAIPTTGIDEIEWLAGALVPYNGAKCGAFSTADTIIAYNRCADAIVAVVRAAVALESLTATEDERAEQLVELFLALDALRAKLREQREM